MDLLEQCELDDEKLMGKTSKQRGVKVSWLFEYAKLTRLTTRSYTIGSLKLV